MNTFINQYFNKEDTFYIFLLNRNTKGTKSYYHNLDSFNKFYKLNYQKWNKKGVDIYFSLNTFKKIDNVIFRRENHIKNFKSIFFDIDINGSITKNFIIKELGIPTYIIQTSEEKYQLIYELNENNISLLEYK